MSEAKPKKKKSKARRIIEWTLIGIIGALFAFVLAGTIDAKVHEGEHYGQPIRFGVGSFVVLTDSMEPEYKVDSAIITYAKDPEQIKNDYDSGKVVDITFYDVFSTVNEYTTPTDTHFNDRTTGRSPVKVITHRVFEVKVDESKNKGEGRYYFFVHGINPNSESFGADNQYQVFTEKQILGVVVLNSNFLGQVFLFVSSPWGLFVLLLIPALYLVTTSLIDIVMALKHPEEELGENPDQPGVGSLDQLSGADRERLKQEMLQQMLEKKRQEREAALLAQQQQEENPAETSENEEKPAETQPNEENPAEPSPNEIEEEQQ